MHEQFAVGRIGAKCGIDQPARAPQGAHGGGGKAGQLRMLLQQQKTFQDGAGCPLEQLVVDCAQLVAARDETVVQGARFGLREQTRAQGLHQHIVQELDLALGAVIAPHHALAGAQLRGRRNAQLLRQLLLVVEHHAVVVATAQLVQTDAHVLQQSLMALCLVCLACREQTVLCQRLPGVSQAGGTRDPQHTVQVAQTAGTFFQIRFQIEIDIGIALVALALFLLFGEIESAHIQMRLHGLLQRIEQTARTVDQACLEQVGLHRDVAAGFDALGHGPHAVADFQPSVPPLADQFPQTVLQGAIRFLRQQNQQINIRARIQLGAAITADSHQRQIAGQPGGAPELAQVAVDDAGVVAQITGRIRFLRIAFEQCLARAAQVFLDRCNGHYGTFRNSLLRDEAQGAWNAGTAMYLIYIKISSAAQTPTRHAQ